MSDNSINTVMSRMLEPAGLDEGHLNATLGSMMRGGVDYADLYFQVSRQESWTVEDHIIREGSFSHDQGVGVRAVSGEKTGFAYSDELMLAALEQDRLAGAALDVFEREPTMNEELFGLPNVVLLPHMGSATIEGRTEMGEKVIINIKTFADGHRPPALVVPSML